MDIPQISASNRVRIVYVVTSSLSARLIRGQLNYLRQLGFEAFLISSSGDELYRTQTLEGVPTVAVPMAREIALWKDLRALWMLWRVMRQLRPSIVNFSTPKAALLGAIAAWLGRVPCRIYMLRGLRFETTVGLKRFGLVLCERIACRCANRIICVSESLRRKAVTMGLAMEERAIVIASGSSNGVEQSRFAPNSKQSCQTSELRLELGIPKGAPIVGFVGRLTRDKGISELVEAYLELRRYLPELRLLCVGGQEKGDPLPPEILHHLENEPGIIQTGFVQDPVPFYHVMDVLALPTHREGFPNVVLEAHAVGKPVVAARATGVVDAVIDGVTGILVPVGDSHALASALARVIQDQRLAAALGSAGRERVLREFGQEIVWDALAQEYLQLLQANGLTVPTGATRNEATVEWATGAARFQ